MQGEYKVKNETLRTLQREAAELAAELRRVTYTAVRRAHNELADRLVNEALDSL
jgi:ribonuclease HI